MERVIKVLCFHRDKCTEVASFLLNGQNHVRVMLDIVVVVVFSCFFFFFFFFFGGGGGW